MDKEILKRFTTNTDETGRMIVTSLKQVESILLKLLEVDIMKCGVMLTLQPRK